MQTMMGLVNLVHEHDFLNELTYSRCGAAVPFAGRYRLIDFTLSNMSHSHIHEVALFTRNKYRSLIDHLGSGADWNLNKRHGGLFILPPDWNDSAVVTKGDLSYFHHHRDYFIRGKSDYVLISGSQFICNAAYDGLFQQHLDRGADVTLLTTTYNELLPEHNACLKVGIGEHGTVQTLTNDPINTRVFSGVYVLKKDLLLKLVDDCIANDKSHFFLDGIQANIDCLTIHAYHYDGYSAIVNDVDSYYRQNMALLNPSAYRQLFSKEQRVWTKAGNQAPAKYAGSARVSRSLIATGGVIEGTVENSVLFSDVRVGKGAYVKNCILMKQCVIEPGAYLENVMMDKDVTITMNQVLIGAEQIPYIIAKRKVV